MTESVLFATLKTMRPFKGAGSMRFKNATMLSPNCWLAAWNCTTSVSPSLIVMLKFASPDKRLLAARLIGLAAVRIGS